MTDLHNYEHNPKDFETALATDQEKQFWPWLERQYTNGAIGEGDYKYYQENGYGYDYDFRHAFLTDQKQAANGHWDDSGKKPNHETFSIYSKYADTPGSKPGSWIGDTYIPYTGDK